MKRATFLARLAALPFVLVVAGCSASAEPTKTASGAVTVDSFESCVDAGGKVMRSYPPKCAATDGRVFVKRENSGRLCTDQCGNGQCEEIVCMAQGCPCPESASTCPQDCKG